MCLTKYHFPKYFHVLKHDIRLHTVQTLNLLVKNRSPNCRKEINGLCERSSCLAQGNIFFRSIIYINASLQILFVSHSYLCHIDICVT